MAGNTAEIMTPDGDADEERGIEIAELYANNYTEDGQLRTTETDRTFIDLADPEPNGPLSLNEVQGDKQKLPEPIIFTEFTVGERALSRRFRQKALGIHAGYLMLRRQHPLLQRHRPGGDTEYRLG